MFNDYDCTKCNNCCKTYNVVILESDIVKNAKLFKEIVNKENKKTAFKNEVGRNELCICGSGKKYKKCCMGI